VLNWWLKLPVDRAPESKTSLDVDVTVCGPDSQSHWTLPPLATLVVSGLKKKLWTVTLADALLAKHSANAAIAATVMKRLTPSNVSAADPYGKARLWS
jgi:hypothetical protein